MIGKTTLTRRAKGSLRRRGLALTRRYLAAQDGAVGTEYGFIIAVIAVVAALGFVTLGGNLTTSFSNLGDGVETAAINMPNPLGGGGVTLPVTEIPPIEPPAEEPPGGGTPPGKGPPPGKGKK